MRFLRAVRSGQAGPPFGKALAAGAVALLDFLSNFLLQRLGGPIKKAATRLRTLASHISDGLGSIKPLLAHGPISAIGRRLRANRAANALISRARMEAPSVRSDLTQLASKHSGSLEGLRYELKGRSSLSRKIQELERAGIPPEKMEPELNDVLRYTVTFDEKTYTVGTKAVLEELKASGYEEVIIPKNFWLRSRYKGVNATLRTPNGVVMELQFHTRGPEGSYAAKQSLTHGLYEKWRTERDPMRRGKLEQRMAALWTRVSVPPGASSIANLRKD
jgi:hypothetical protein